MRIFDGHSDIFTDVTMKRLEGKKNIIKNYHFEKLKAGNVAGTILVVWVDPPHTSDPTWRMLEVLGAASEEIEDMKDCAAVALKVEDMDTIQKSGKVPIIIGMEGLSGLRGNVSLLNMLYRVGVRHASLTWNEDNEFATGVISKETDRGLTDLGIQAVKRMEELGILIDVSHLNDKSFWDVYNNTTKPFIASHSNARTICDVPRNLTDDMIKAIAERGGTIGMNAWPDFIDNKNPNVENLSNHIDYIANLVGIDHIAFGFDFCDFLEGDTTASFQGGESVSSKGFEDSSKIPLLIELLSRKGYKTADIEKIAYGNIERVLKTVLK